MFYYTGTGVRSLQEGGGGGCCILFLGDLIIIDTVH